MVVGLVTLLVASYCDIKSREVPDWISFAFVFAVIGIRAIYSFQEGVFYLVSGLLGFLFFLALGLLLSFLKVWGGADSKILAGMGGLLGMAYPFNLDSLLLIWFYALIFIAGIVYYPLWKAGVAIYTLKNKKKIVGTPFIPVFLVSYLIILLVPFSQVVQELLFPALQQLI